MLSTRIYRHPLQANDVASVFLSVEVLVLRAAQQSSPGGLVAEVAMDLVKRVLADYGKEVVVCDVTLTTDNWHGAGEPAAVRHEHGPPGQGRAQDADCHGGSRHGGRQVRKGTRRTRNSQWSRSA